MVCVLVICGCAAQHTHRTSIAEPSKVAAAPLAAGETINMTSYTDRGGQGWPCTIDAQGNIALGLLGSVHVAGLTPTEAGKKIERMWLEKTLPDWYQPVRVEISR